MYGQVRGRRRAWDSWERTQEKPAVVYRAWDGEGRLLYIGCTVDLEQRLRQHRETSPWYPYAVTVSSVAYSTRAEAAEAESEAIRTEDSWLNGHGSHFSQVQAWRHTFRRVFFSTRTCGCGYAYESYVTECPQPDEHARAMSVARDRADRTHGPCQDTAWRLARYLEARQDPATTHPSQVAVRLPSHGQSLG